jgi:hypothetical protein
MTTPPKLPNQRSRSAGQYPIADTRKSSGRNHLTSLRTHP